MIKAFNYFIILCIWLGAICMFPQEILMSDVDLPEDIRTNVQSLITLRKNKNYKEIIDLAAYYKLKNQDFYFVFDLYLIESYFFERNFDKVIELALPYESRKQSIIADGDIKSYLGQSYVNLNKKIKGCELLSELINKDVENKIVYLYNCAKYSEYNFKVSGKEMNHTTNIVVNSGDVVEFKASGKVSYGIFSGYSGPQGFSNGQFRAYNRTPDLNHGALFFTTTGDPYLFYESSNIHYIKSSGRLVFHINDKQPQNNSGAFSVSIKVYRAQNN